MTLCSKGSEIRVVLDTSVFVSAALLPRSEPRGAFDLAVTHCTLLVSTATLMEVAEVLRRAKFDKYVAEERRLEFLAAMVREAEVIEVNETISACRDPSDDKFLELALSGNATHIITGDADLLALHPFRGVEILRPADFVALASQ